MNPSLLIGIALIAAALASVAPPAAAERAIRQIQVQFPKDSNATRIRGRVTGDETLDYVLRAAAGQTLAVTMSTRPVVYFNVLPPGSSGEAIFIGARDGSVATIPMPAGGRYTIRVYQMGAAKHGGKRSDFTLDVAVTGAAPSGSAPGKHGEGAVAEAAGRASEGRFDATGRIPCAQSPGQPMGQCDFGVARAAGATAAVSVTHPDGRKRVILFQDGQAIGAAVSQADGGVKFSAGKQSDLHLIQVGDERYEIPQAVIDGG